MKDQPQTTSTKETYDLVKGTYSPEDGHEIIVDLLSKKISFHVQKNFSRIIRFGSEDERSLTRIQELNETKEKARALIQQAGQLGKSVRIHSTITIEII